MAAGSVVLYDHAKEFMLDGTIDLDDHTFVAALVSAGYSPSLASDSVWADISSFETSASGYTEQTLANVTWSRVGSNTVRFDADNLAFSASGTMNAKRVIIRDDDNDKLVCYFDTNTSESSGVDATQITVTWPSAGIFELS